MKQKRSSCYLQLLKPSKSWLCSSVHLLQINCLVYGDWAFEVTLHSSSARLDGIYPVQIHLITTASVIKRLSLYEFTLWGQDLVSVVRIRESPYYRGYFLQKKYENHCAKKVIFTACHSRKLKLAFQYQPPPNF